MDEVKDAFSDALNDDTDGFGADSFDVTYADKTLTFKQVAARQNITGGPITGRAGVNPGGPGPSISTHVVDVEVSSPSGAGTLAVYGRQIVGVAREAVDMSGSSGVDPSPRILVSLL